MRKFVSAALACLTLATPLVLLQASASHAQAAPAGGAAAGEKTFKQRCAVCHTVAPGAKAGVGPNLRGVVGRKAGTSPGFNYSASMKASANVWNAASLDKYLASPGKVVPGTRMVISLPNPADRAAVIAYLQAQK
ncbi:cytochrome C class I [Novosphingobium sp. Rr 2-17]|uniref:c-type cytochrome n=1 Tax=Novosphingobium sp. Rr 2-17 TaxID=555793 RepID=UPI000269A1D8|nr:c-type cytochrome [Novosphingobium sp. Rr 2-17]EIZ79728.1 cytochrome C class I [Novosphingobium sp. Rr 2-17]